MLDLMGFGLCSFMMSTVQLDSLKVCAYLYVGLVIYDIFWVFFSVSLKEGNSSFILHTSISTRVRIRIRMLAPPKNRTQKRTHTRAHTHERASLTL